MALIRNLEGDAGRAVRAAAGVVLIGLGAWLGSTAGGAWWVLAAVGVVPLAAAAAGVCLIAPLAHEPLRGTSRQA
ncbi:MAG: DUF2892 domain-containing protein [Actinomycetota bacterium]|nr:DUF2892 domain-containing protein [Actinomycetota bacterium]